MRVVPSTYGPTSFCHLLLAVHLEKPVGRSSDLQVVHPGILHPCVQQVHAGVALKVYQVQIL